MKTCSKCKIEKDDDLFSFRSDRKEVRNSWCKDCNKEYKRIKSVEYRKNKQRISEINVSEKVCSICSINKPSSEFYSDFRNNSGIRSSCKECDRNLSKKYIDKNRELISIRNRENYLKNREYNLKRFMCYVFK